MNQDTGDDRALDPARRPLPGPGHRPLPGPGTRPLAVPPPPAPARRVILVAGVAGLFAAAGLSGRTDADAGAASRDEAGGRPARTGGASVVAARQPHVGGHPAPHRSGRWHAAVRSLDDVDRHAGRAVFAKHAVALTLDDGPSPLWTPRFLDLLAHHGILATFFVIGSQVHRDPGLVREVASRGHVVGNHTWTHDEQLTQRPLARIRSEIERTSHAIHAATGHEPTLFRAPGGNWGPRLLDVLAEHRLVPVGWDVDPTDWARPGVRAIERSLHRVRPHDIALCHDGGGDRSQTYRALQATLPLLLQRGYTFTTLAGAAAA